MRTAGEFHRSRNRPSGLNARCKSCYRASYNPEDSRKQLLRLRYGLSWDDYLSLHAAQGGACAICSKPLTLVVNDRMASAHVDHDHATGVVRGLLCHHCNSGIGHLCESTERLRRAAEYLEHATLFPLPLRRRTRKRRSAVTQEKVTAVQGMLASGASFPRIVRELRVSRYIVDEIANGRSGRLLVAPHRPQ